MTQTYSNPERADDPHALPDVEVFYMDADDCAYESQFSDPYSEFSEFNSEGWYWWPCFPGCLPDSDPVGPFATEQEAIEDAQDNGL